MHDFHLRIVEAREASAEFITHLKMFIGLSRIISSSFRSECVCMSVYKTYLKVWL